MDFFTKSTFFSGSKDRLERMIQRENGKILSNQRFSLVIKDKKVKKHIALPLYFHCRFQKVDNGFKIQYFVIPSLFGFIRFMISFALLSIIVYQKQLCPYITYSIFILLYFINYFYQRSHCIRQFEAMFQK